MSFSYDPFNHLDILRLKSGKNKGQLALECHGCGKEIPINNPNLHLSDLFATMAKHLNESHEIYKRDTVNWSVD